MTIRAFFRTALVGAAFMTAVASTAQQTRVINADKHNEYGLVYSLPLTSVRFDVTAKRTVSKAGPFFQYAKKYLGTDRVIKEDSESWQIISVTATPVGTPDTDPEAQYLMQLKPGAITYICVADDGMLLAVNKDVDYSAPAPADTESNPEGSLNVREYLQYVNEDFLASQSSAKQAQMLSESLMEVRDSKIALTRGTAETMPTDGRQLELMLNSLTHQEEVLSAAFLGSTQTQTLTRSFMFTPDGEGRTVLFRMSDFCGFTDPSDYSGAPVYVDVKITREGELPVDSKGEEKKFPKDGVAYRIPGAANISLSLDGRTLWNDEVECAQFGVTFGLNPSLFTDKKAPSFATFDPATGALVKIGELNGE